MDYYLFMCVSMAYDDKGKRIHILREHKAAESRNMSKYCPITYKRFLNVLSFQLLKV